MPEYMVEIYEQRGYSSRLTADSKEELKDQLRKRLEEVSPEEIAGVARVADIQHIRVRELYDWEKGKAK